MSRNYDGYALPAAEKGALWITTTVISIQDLRMKGLPRETAVFPDQCRLAHH